MRIVGLDDDVYAYLVSHTRELGETPSQILRRLLAIGVEGPRHAREKRIAAALHPSRPHELTRCIKRAAWLAFDVERYLYLLRCLHDQKGFDFMVQALQIRGRTRRYFGRSAGDIERSGVATQPRPIAG